MASFAACRTRRQAWCTAAHGWLADRLISAWFAWSAVAGPDVPTAGEAYREIYGTEPSGPAWEAYVASVRAAGNGGKILLTHKDVEPAARVALKRAIDVMIKDPEYLKKAESVLEGYGFNTGDNLVSTIDAIDRMKQEDIAWLQNLLSRDFRLKFN